MTPGRRSTPEVELAWLCDELAQLTATTQAIARLFAGGPDTVRRTTWREGVECVEVPIADLRAAFLTVADHTTPRACQQLSAQREEH